jgi:hypothetical protein
MLMKRQMIMTIVIVAVLAGILIAASAVSQDTLAKSKKKHRNGSDSKQSQTIAQANVCGNGNLPMNIKCQNLASQIQGNGNAVNGIGLQ